MEHLVEFVRQLHKAESYSDIRIVYKDEAIRAHKFVIVNNTDYWGDLTDLDEIEIDASLDRDVLTVMLEWMYTFTLSEQWGYQFLLRLVDASHNFKLKDLFDVAIHYLVSDISIGNCIPIYEKSLAIPSDYLRDGVSQFITKSWSSLTKDHFKDLAPDILIALLTKNVENVIHSILKIGRADVLKLYLEENEVKEELNTEDEHGLFPLDIAFSTCDLTSAEVLYEHGTDVNAINKEGKCLLAKAIEKGDLSVLTFLVGKEANVNYVSRNGRTLLHDLSFSDEQSHILPWVKENINRFNINAVDEEKRSPLFYAVYKQNLPILELLLSHDNIDVASDRALLELALFKHQNLDVSERLIGKGASLDFADDEGNTVFHKAIQNEQWSLIGFLVKNSKRINDKNNSGRTPLHLLLSTASICGLTSDFITVDVLKMLLKAGADPLQFDDTTDQTALHYAARLPAFVLKILLEYCDKEHLNVRDKNGNSMLWHVLINGHFETATLLVKSGADINEGTSEGNSLILRALVDKREDIVHFLITSNASINVRNVDGRTCLALAVENGLISTVDTLCKLGASLNTIDPFTQDVPLYIALKNNDYGTAQVLISHGCDLEAVKSIDGVQKSLLRRAIEDGDVKVATFLIKNGCNVNAPEKSELESPLHLSVKHELNEVTSLLLSNLKCRVGHQDIDGNTVAHLAVLRDDKDTLDLILAHPRASALLIRNKLGQTPLCIAMEHKSNKIAEAICNRLPHAALEVNADGENLLHIGIKGDDLESVLFLLGLQIDVNISTENNQKLQPLHLSAQYSNGLIMRNIILAGAELDAKDSFGRTALHIAAMYDRTEHLKILLENGADPNALDNESNNPLHFAVMESAFQSAQVLLLESSVDPLATNKMGRNAVHLCASISGLGAAEMFQTVIEIIPNYPLETGDIYGNTAFLLSFINGNGDLCRLMLKYGVCLSARNKKGESVFHLQIPSPNFLESLLICLDREPKWGEGDACSDCDIKFSLTMRKHHCRHCGRLTCSKCSEQQIPILKYNLAKNVRVCRVCYAVLTTGISSKPSPYPLE
ncbi:unnamed protein product [Bursaphelenchus okinawaensis]|uniref:ANK_REP_REGION domain-containing protein n=1 Tax=Bursaphelenchus okinawaensis TaxID=465554 RepID=A0A811JTP5_9BILA|nr:unnamed protein product [Bursaphelenchus okinawaensis]CAG9082603.1 unnamed protein product [Bursaphelenchus okinawaensis]